MALLGVAEAGAAMVMTRVATTAIGSSRKPGRRDPPPRCLASKSMSRPLTADSRRHLRFSPLFSLSAEVQWPTMPPVLLARDARPPTLSVLLDPRNTRYRNVLLIEKFASSDNS